MRNGLKTLVAALAAVLTQSASATNLVANGDFETIGPGGAAGWMVSSGWYALEWRRGIHSGTVAIGSGCSDWSSPAMCYFQQTLNTVAGQRYDVSFWLYADGIVNELGEVLQDSPNGLQVRFDGATIYSAVNIAPTNSPGTYMGGPSTLITIHGVQATSDQTLLSFYGYHNYHSVIVDDVSVMASAPAVPEPSTLLLAGMGLGVVCGIARRAKASKI